MKANGLVVDYNSTNTYYKNGKIHREDGPAIEYTNSKFKEWWIDGKRINVSSQKEFEKFLKMKAFW